MPAIRLRPRVAKHADLGGDGQRTDMESALADMGHIHLRDRAPRLMQYEIGFELLENRPEENEAAGVFGFRIGREYAFVPIFFLNGEIKGHELLYLKNRDMFVPLADAWVDHLASRSPDAIGRARTRDRSRKPGRSAPDLRFLTETPQKYAAASAAEAELGDEADAINVSSLDDATRAAFLDLPAWTRIASACLAKAASHVPAQPVLTDVLALGEAPSAQLLADLRDYPLCRAAYAAYLDAETVKEAAARGAARARTTRTLKRERRRASTRRHRKCAQVAVWRLGRTTPAQLDLLDEEARATLWRDGVLVEDWRDESAVKVAVDLSTNAELFNPTETGLYDVLMRDGSSERCLVICQPLGESGHRARSLVVRASDGPRRWVCTAPSSVYATARHDGDLAGFLDNLPAADNLPASDDVDQASILIRSDGIATVPLRPIRALGDQSYRVSAEYIGGCDELCRGIGPKYDREFATAHPPAKGGLVVHLGRPAGSRLKLEGSDLYVPSDARRLAVREGVYSDDAILLGGPGTIRRILDRAAAPLKVAALRDGGYRIDGTALTPVDALEELIVARGLRTSAARDVLAAAERGHGKEARFALVKAADPLLMDDGPEAPEWPDPEYGEEDLIDVSVRSQVPQSEHLEFGGGTSESDLADAYDPSQLADLESAGVSGPGPGDLGAVLKAHEWGDQDLFETSAIGRLLRPIRGDDLIEDDVPVIARGMDRIGRQLLKFYWHKDKYVERYGDDDVKELEDGLRNTFEASGDLVLFLKQRTVDDGPAAGQSIDLDEIS